MDSAAHRPCASPVSCDRSAKCQTSQALCEAAYCTQTSDQVAVVRSVSCVQTEQ
jgi:hypothetical protein